MDDVSDAPRDLFSSDVDLTAHEHDAQDLFSELDLTAHEELGDLDELAEQIRLDDFEDSDNDDDIRRRDPNLNTTAAEDNQSFADLVDDLGIEQCRQLLDECGLTIVAFKAQLQQLCHTVKLLIQDMDKHFTAVERVLCHRRTDERGPEGSRD